MTMVSFITCCSVSLLIGAGKSLVYQLPSLMQTPEFADTLTVVVSPLVSLMTDQAIGLRQLNIAPNSVAVLDASTLPAEQQKIYLAISGDDRPKVMEPPPPLHLPQSFCQ